jgi:hypothetical protein
MTRKRFIKLYMARGISGDDVNQVADYALQNYRDYERYYNSLQAKTNRGEVIWGPRFTYEPKLIH